MKINGRSDPRAIGQAKNGRLSGAPATNNRGGLLGLRINLNFKEKSMLREYVFSCPILLYFFVGEVRSKLPCVMLS